MLRDFRLWLLDLLVCCLVFVVRFGVIGVVVWAAASWAWWGFSGLVRGTVF